MGSEAWGRPLKTCLRGHADFTESQVPLSLCRIQASTLPTTLRAWLKQVPVPSPPNPPKLVPKIPDYPLTLETTFTPVAVALARRPFQPFNPLFLLNLIYILLLHNHVGSFSLSLTVT